MAELMNLQKTVPQMADHMFTMNGTATVSSNGEPNLE